MRSVRSMATSAAPFRSTTRPRRQAPSQVISTSAPASSTRSTMASEEKPPKMTLWAAPMRAQASMATANSGTMPM